MFREGVKGLWGREDGQEISPVQLLLIVVVSVRTMPSGGNVDATHAPSGRGRRVGQHLQIVTAVMTQSKERT